jgi:hypothetical protein
MDVYLAEAVSNKSDMADESLSGIDTLQTRKEHTKVDF